MSKINPNDFIFDNLEETGWTVFFYHYPYSTLPIRDIRRKTEPHIEIGADNFLRRCHQDNAIIPFLKSKAKYLFFSTVCENPPRYGRIKQIVGYIEKKGFIKRDDKKGTFYAVLGEPFFIPFKFAPTHREFGLINGRRFGSVNGQITRKILTFFSNIENIFIQCVKEIYDACKSSNYYRLIDS